MAHIKESPVEWTTKRSRVFPVYTTGHFRPPSVAPVRSSAWPPHVHTLTRVPTGHLLFCRGIVPRRCDTCKGPPAALCLAKLACATCGGRVNRETRKTLGAPPFTPGRVCKMARLLLAENAIQCGARGSRGGSKGRVYTGEKLCRASEPNRFLHRKQKTIVFGEWMILLSRARNKAP